MQAALPCGEKKPGSHGVQSLAFVDTKFGWYLEDIKNTIIELLLELGCVTKMI
jgi:hypothetical protein